MRPYMERPLMHAGGHEWLGAVFLFLVVVALVVGAILIARTLANRPRGEVRDSGPLRILEERFARGEIDEQEFRARRDALRS